MSRIISLRSVCSMKRLGFPQWLAVGREQPSPAGQRFDCLPFRQRGHTVQMLRRARTSPPANHPTVPNAIRIAKLETGHKPSRTMTAGW